MTYDLLIQSTLSKTTIFFIGIVTGIIVGFLIRFIFDCIKKEIKKT